MNKTISIPRYRLTHLLAYLRRGEQIQIANIARCHPAYVSAILNGKTSQTSSLAKHIIRLAEDRIRINSPCNYK